MSQLLIIDEIIPILRAVVNLRVPAVNANFNSASSDDYASCCCGWLMPETIVLRRVSTEDTGFFRLLPGDSVVTVL